jgi:hypothetical protein
VILQLATPNTCCPQADVCVSFRLASKVDDVLLVDKREIAKRYAKSWLLVDGTASVAAILEQFLASMSMMKSTRVLKFFRILKLVRAFKLANMVGGDVQAEVNTGLKMLKLFLISVTFSHLCACAFFGATDRDETSWVRDYLGDGYFRLGIERQYTVALYWAFVTITTVGFGG